VISSPGAGSPAQEDLVVQQIARAAVAAALLSSCTPAFAQSLTPASHVVPAGGSTNVTASGSPGQQYALIASTTNSGFSYAGVNLAVGTDVQVLAIGALDGAGQAVVPVTPPFPARDRYYVQAVFTNDGFASITPSNFVVLINYQAASLFMPIGGLVSSTGVLLSGTPGVTVTRTAVGAYTITHTGFFPLTGAVPTVTPIIGNPTTSGLSTTPNATMVTFSADVTFYFVIQPIRR
jgi:hypothetical protein